MLRLDRRRRTCGSPPAWRIAQGRPTSSSLLTVTLTCTATVPIAAAPCANRMPAKTIRLSGWCHRIRDHGGVLFIDLRDHYGITQCVVDPDSPAFGRAEKLRSEWVIRVDGAVRQRPAGTENPEMPTGLIEVYVTDIEVLGPAAELPLPVFGEQNYPEDMRLRYRFLDLRREKLHKTSCCAVKSSIRSAPA